MDELNNIIDTETAATDVTEQTVDLSISQIIGLSTLAGAAGGGLIIGIYEGGCWIAKKIKEHKAKKAKELAEAKKD